MKSKYEIVIVGAGPAGLQAAKVLAENGRQVVVFEKNKVPGDKVCAGGLTLKDLELGIPDDILERKFKKVIVNTQRQKRTVEQDNIFIVTINRKTLGKWQMEEAKKAGAEVVFNAEVTDIGKETIKVLDKEIKFDFLIGADGPSSFVRRSLGIKTDELLVAFHYIVPGHFEDLEIYMDPTRFGMTYIWVFPHKDCASIGIVLDVGRSIQLDDLKKEFHLWLRERKISIDGAKFESSPINYDYEGFEFGNKFLIGGAGGFTSGLTGEGIYSAIISGEEVALKIINQNYNFPRIKAWLEIKKLHEGFLRLTQKSKVTTETLAELTAFFIENRFISSELIRLATGG